MTRQTPRPVNHRTLVGNARRQRTREKIIESAMLVFAKTGGKSGEKAPMIDDFIRAAGVARGTFYNYFRTTQELLDATIAWSSDDVIKSIEAEIGAHEDAALRLATACRLYLRLAESDRAWCAFMIQAPQIGMLTRRRLRADLRNGLAAGHFSFANIDAAFDLVNGAMHHALRRLASGARGYSSAIMVNMMLRGLGVSERKVNNVINTELPDLHRPIKSEAVFEHD